MISIKFGNTPEVVMVMIDRKDVDAVAAALEDGGQAIKYDAAENSDLLTHLSMKLQMESMAADVSYGPAGRTGKRSPVKPRSNVVSMDKYRERKAR